MLARVYEGNFIGWELVTLKKIEIHSFDPTRSRVVATCSVCPVECHYEVSRSHLHGDPLQIEIEEIAIFNRGYPIFKISNPQEIRRFNMGEIGATRPA